MNAIFFSQFKGPLSVIDIPIPAPTNDGVVIKVEATGLCRSDWHAWMGHDPDIVLPHVPGHEFAGVISAIGSSVSKYSIGDRVTVPFVSGCGKCGYCLRGDAQVCPTQTQPGFTGYGSFAEYVAINNADFNLVKITVRAETSKVLKTRRFVIKDLDYFDRLFKLQYKRFTDEYEGEDKKAKFANTLIFRLNGESCITPRSIGYHFDKIIELAEIKHTEKELQQTRTYYGNKIKDLTSASNSELEQFFTDRY